MEKNVWSSLTKYLTYDILCQWYTYGSTGMSVNNILNDLMIWLEDIFLDLGFSHLDLQCKGWWTHNTPTLFYTSTRTLEEVLPLSFVLQRREGVPTLCSVPMLLPSLLWLEWELLKCVTYNDVCGYGIADNLFKVSLLYGWNKLKNARQAELNH